MLRRDILALPLACLLPAYALAAGPEPLLAEEDIQVSYEEDTYFGRFSVVVPVPQALAWEVLTDFDRMAGFVPNLEDSRILSREGNILVVAQRGKLSLGPFTVRFESERRVEMRQREGLLIARAVSGSAKRMVSEMRLAPEGGGTRLDYRVEMVPEHWIPTNLGQGFMRHEMAQQFSALAREMVRRQHRRKSA